jgi:HEPN domain-containing protein
MNEINRYIKEAERWFEQALEDLKSAQILLEHKRYYLVCFISQQVVEKALKSVIYFNKEDLVLGHSVKKLADWAGNFDEQFKKLSENVSILDSYYIPTRYPNGLPDGIPADVFNKKAAVDALDLAQTTINLVKLYLNL